MNNDAQSIGRHLNALIKYDDFICNLDGSLYQIYWFLLQYILNLVIFMLLS